jgi:hypothetical protein
VDPEDTLQVTLKKPTRIVETFVNDTKQYYIDTALAWSEAFTKAASSEGQPAYGVPATVVDTVDLYMAGRAFDEVTVPVTLSKSSFNFTNLVVTKPE